MDIKKLFPIILFVLFISVGHVVANDKSQRLQALLDAYSNTSATQLIIDLTAENVSGEIDETVYVRNRSNIKFVNGTLTSVCLPMIEITDEGKLEVGNGVTIIGNGSGDIHIKGGTMIASVGSVMKLRNYATQKHNRSRSPNSIPPEPFYMDKLITLLTDGSIFILDGGIINGGLAVKDKQVNVTIQSGKIETIQEENSNDDNIIGKPSVSINGGEVGLIGNYYYGSFNANLYVNGGYVDYIGTYGSVRVSGTAEVNELIQMPSDTDESPKCQFMGGRVHHAQTSYNAWIRGDVRVDSLCLPVKDTYLMCWGDLNHDICLGVMGRVEGDAIAKGLNTLTAFREDFDSTGAPDSFIKHQITESDKEHIKAYTNEGTVDGNGLINYTTSNWQWCHEYPQSTTLKDNSIILKSTTQANEAYAVYTTDGTLTFYYDAQRNSRTGTTYSLGGLGPNWNTYVIQKVVFTPSFADARPTTTSSWFAGTDGYPGEGLPSSISKIEGIEYLNTSKVTDMSQMFYKCHNLRSLDVSNFDTSNVTDMRYMFFGCSGLISLGISNFNTSNLTNIRSIFSGCSSLTSIDLSNFDTSKVTSMWGVFYGCNGLTSLDLSHFDTSKVTDMGCMFKDCISLSTIYIGEKWNIEKVTESSSMFNGCTNLVGGAGTKYDANHVDVTYAHIDGGPSNPGYLTDKNAPAAKEAYAVYTDDGTLTFYYDAQRNSRTGATYHLNTGTDYPGWKYNSTSKNIKKVVFNSSFAEAKPTSTSYWFSYSVPNVLIGDSEKSVLSEIVGIEYLNTSEVRTMNWMFSGCTALTSLDLSHFDTGKVTNMGCMFAECNGLTSLDVTNFNTSNVTTMYSMFRGCNKLTSLDLSHFDTNNVTDMRYMFEDCSNLINIFVGEGWNTDNVTQSENMFLNCTNLVGGAGTKFDANHVDVAYAHIDGGLSNPGYLTDKNATSLMNLQEFIDANAEATSVVDVDLSKFENDLVREQTLNVSTGASYRFINGTLTRHSSLKGPILYVSEGSEVQIETNVAIGGNFPYLGYSGNPVITLNHGKLFVRGTVTAGHTMATNVSSRSDVAIQMESDADDFRLLGGSIYGPIVSKAKGYIWLADGTINLQYGDNWSVSTYGNIELGSIADESILSPLNINLLERQSRVLLCSSLSANVSITNIQKQINDIIVAGYKESYDPRLGSVYTYLHAITEDDLQKVRFTGSSSFSLSLEGNAIYLRGSEDELPNSGCDEEWLQQKLDEIASKKPSEPVELTICEDGITLTKNIKVDKDCKVVLTGGPITSGTSIDYRYGREGLFMVYGELGFHDIKLTFDNDAKRDGSLGYFWSGGGKLELNKGTIASTTNGTFVGGLGELTITDAELYIGGDEMIISSDINTTISDYVCLVGQKTYCNGKIAIDGRTDPETGWEQYPIFRVGEVHVTSSLDLRAPKNSGMKIYLYKDASINTYEQGFIEMHISGEWDQMAVGGAFVTSESIGQYDYNKMTFMGMPIDRKAEFVPGSHQVRLMSTSQIDMQTNLSGLAYVSQTAPTTLYLSSDAVNTVYQSAEINHQDVSFNGMPNGATSRGRIHFTKDQILTINKDGRLTLTNIDITGEDGNERFDVSGKLVIAENVHVSDMSCFLRICSGGSLYASAELKTPIRILFENGPYSGNTIIAGTNGYQLTEADLSNVIVDGCELQIDRANNRIVVLSGMGIETINGNSKTMFKEGVFDLYGRKVVPARQGIYIMRESNVTKKIYVK